MRVRNRAAISVLYQFAGPNGPKKLAPGELSPRLPATRFYDERLQHALSRGLISVEFDERDVGIVGVAGMPGPVAQALANLPSAKAEEERPAAIVAEPKPVVTVTEPFDPPKRKKPKPLKPMRANTAKTGLTRAKDVAKSLHIPVHVLSAFNEKNGGRRLYPVTGMTKEEVAAAEERYGSKIELPEISHVPRDSVSAAALSLSELSAGSDGLSLADLISENDSRPRRGG